MIKIKALNLSLDTLNTEIVDTEGRINQTENSIENHKGALSQAVRNLHESDSQGLAEILLANNHLSDFF